MKKSRLTNYYDELPKPVAPKTEFVEKISVSCEVNQATVRLWLKGKTRPSNPEHVKVLSQETGIPEDELFKDA